MKMTNLNENNVIDLTDSFELVDHTGIANIVIDLDYSVTTEHPVRRSNITRQSKKGPKKPPTRERSIDLGDCPICWDQIGTNPLASTKCGHVFCMKCIKQSLQLERKCPTCRRQLNGTSAFHPLYLSPQTEP